MSNQRGNRKTGVMEAVLAHCQTGDGLPNEENLSGHAVSDK
jgi:hypothetical protein